MYAPEVCGSVIVHDTNDCILVIGCHQFRMHASKGSAIYIQPTSGPIIEHCLNLTFGPLHASAEQGREETAYWSLVQDFDWLQGSKGDSPNWRKVPALSAESEELMRMILDDVNYDDSRREKLLLSLYQ